VRLTDTTWSELQAARMAGLDTYYGNPVSAHADRYLDLTGIGRLFAMSRRPALNTLACIKYRSEFSPQRVFTLRNAEEKDDQDKIRINDSFRAPRLFGENVSMQKLASMIAQGAEIRATDLSEEYDFETWRAAAGRSSIPLFAIDPDQRLRAFTDDYQPELKPGWTVLALVPANDD
jgi:hypothetical protein